MLPLTLYETQRKHVLIQNFKGEGAYIQVDENCKDLQCVCELTGRTISAGIDLRMEKKGWHNIVVVCNNIENERGNIKFMINGKPTRDFAMDCLCLQPIGYIGNSKNGANPWGIVCDLRIYPFCLDKQRIEKLNYYETNYEFDMPDKYFSVFVEIGMVKLILDDLPRYAR